LAHFLPAEHQFTSKIGNLMREVPLQSDDSIQGAQRQGKQGKVGEFSSQGKFREKSENLICDQGKSFKAIFTHFFVLNSSQAKK